MPRIIVVNQVVIIILLIKCLLFTTHCFNIKQTCTGPAYFCWLTYVVNEVDCLHGRCSRVNGWRSLWVVLTEVSLFLLWTFIRKSFIGCFIIAKVSDVYSTQEDQWHHEKATIHQKNYRYQVEDSTVTIGCFRENFIHELTLS